MGASPSVKSDATLTRIGGPRPFALDDDAALKLAKETTQTFMKNERRKRQWHRWLVLEEDFRGLVAAEIDVQFQDPTIKDRLRKLISISRNSALDVVRKVCVVYDGGVTRRVEGEDVTPDQQDALAELAAESGIDEDATDWHRYAYGIGPCQAIPQITDGELSFDFLVPHVYEAVFHPLVRRGALFAAWEYLDPHGDVTAVVLDDQAWRYYDAGPGKDPELVDTVPHGLGVFPGSTLRFNRSYGTDQWCVSRLERVYGGTLEVAITNTILQIVRRSQNRKLASVVGELGGLGTGAVLETEVAIAAEGEPDSLKVDVHDFDVDPKNFINHINWMEAGIIESFGIPAHAVTFDPTSGTEGERILFTQQGLTEIRKQQLPKIRRFERDLWYRAVLLCKRHGHRLANRLPDPQAILRGFRLDVPPLAQAFTDPLVEQKWWDGEIKAGQATYEDRMMSRNPGMSRKEAHARVMANIEAVADVREVLASRIFRIDLTEAADEAVNADSKPGEGIAEALGREGGKASGVARAADDGDSDDDE